VKVGPLESRKGELVCGFLDLLPLASGRAEVWPLMVLEGRRPGPTVWLTANIHGNELTGLAVIHRLVRSELAERLSGTIVAIPTLNPAGLLTGSRAPYYWAQASPDPNRQFPALRSNGDAPDSAFEQVAARLFELVRGSADLVLDLHCASIQSVPHVILDRVLYQREDDRPAAERVAERAGGLAESLGLPVVREFPTGRYVDEHLDRSLSGACVNVARVPAVTVELGAPEVVDPAARELGVAAVTNALVWAGMLPGRRRSIRSVRAPTLSGPLSRELLPRAPQAGIVSFRVAPGDTLEPGDVVADLVDIFGSPTAGGEVRAGRAGWVVALQHGLSVYAHEPLAALAVADDEPLVARHPLA
jgi:predicted deacylase